MLSFGEHASREEHVLARCTSGGDNYALGYTDFVPLSGLKITCASLLSSVCRSEWTKTSRLLSKGSLGEHEPSTLEMLCAKLYRRYR
jgi:hypothetical protein